MCSDVCGVVYWDSLLGHGREAVNLLLQVVRVDLACTGVCSRGFFFGFFLGGGVGEHGKVRKGESGVPTEGD